MSCFAWGVIIPLSSTSPPTPLHMAVNAAGLTLFGAALLLVLWASVSADLTARAMWSRAALVLAVALSLWVPAHAWAEAGKHPWAWIAGFTIAACALLSWQCAGIAGLTLGSAAYAGSAALGTSPRASLLTLLMCALVVWAMCHALVWMLRLLLASQAGREAQVELAIAQERLRASRELHDLLGHRLSVITLKAELAAHLVGHDPGGAAAQSDEIRALATAALAEARQAIRGQTVTDLPSQLHAAELVLGSVGIAVSLDAPHTAQQRLSQPCSELTAAVVREAVTNVLRHSDATRVRIALTETAHSVTLTIANDGVRETTPAQRSDGTGLAGLGARCAALGARLTVIQGIDSSFELRVECVSDLADA